MATVVDNLMLKLRVDTSGFNKAMQRIKGNMLGAGLSFLFTGMAIKRFFQTTLQSLFSTFLLIEGEMGVVNNAINNLKGALLFLKFSIVDAFKDTGAMDKWIERIDRLLTFFTNLDEETKVFFVEFAIGAVIAGAALMILGQTMLGVLGLISLIQLIGFPVFLGLVFLVLLLASGFVIWNSKVQPVVKALQLLAIIAAGLFVGFTIFFGIVIGLWALLITVIVGLTAFLVVFFEAAIGGLLLLGEAIIDSMLHPLNLVIGAINLIITGLNKVSGSNIDIIPKISALKSGLFTQTEFSKNLFARHEAKATGIFGAGRGQILPEGALTNTLMDALKSFPAFNIPSPPGGDQFVGDVIMDGEKFGDFVKKTMQEAGNFQNGSTTQFNN